MSYCDDCLHKEVCGEEGVGDESMTFCRDKVISCDEAISRQAVLDLIADYDLSMGQVVNGIHTLPPVTPQPKTGHWIRWYEQKENDRCIEYRPHCKCSECGKEYDPHSSQFIKYCSYCGAKMVESEEKNDAV